MTAVNFPAILKFTLNEEGGFSNDPRDPGGATEHGITLKTYRNMMHNQNLTVNDLKNINFENEEMIYRAGYWNNIQGDALPPGVDLMVFDEGVNTGPTKSIVLLQRAVGVLQDGRLGSKTLTAICAADPRALILKLSNLHVTNYQSLSNYPVFGRGWLARAGRRLTAALAMAGAPPVVAPGPEIALQSGVGDDTPSG